jgi:fibronectin type 3 domain-containing protein
MRTAVLAVLSLLFPLAASAATLVSSRTFNGAFSSSDSIRAAVAAPGGGYYLAGHTYGPNDGDIWVLKVDAALNVVSSITLNGPANGYDFGTGIGVSSAGEVYVVGATSVTSVGMKAWVGRFSSSLTLVSSYTYIGGQAIANDFNTSFDALAFEPSGDFLVAGDAYVNPGDPWSSITLFRFSPALTLLATAAYNNGFASEYGSSILRVASGDIYVGGGVAPAALTSSNAWIGKFDSSLVLQATATVAGAGGNTDQVRGIAQGSNGDIYVTGIINNSGVTTDAWFGRYTSALAPVSNFSLAGVAATNDQGNALAAGWPGSLYAAASLSQAGQGENLALVQLSENAYSVVSTTTVNSSGSSTDIAYAVAVDSVANTALLAGFVNSGADGWAGLFSFNTPGPAAPSGFAGAASSSTSINWSWTDNSSDEAGFRVVSGTISLSGDLAANTSSWLQTGLTPNAAQTLFARAYNSTGTADSSAVTRYTLAEPPSSVSITYWGSSVTLSWPTMGNPASTVWSVERGTNGVSYPLQLYLSSAAASFTGDTLGAGTSYYYRVRAVNADGVHSFHANASGVVFTGGAPAAPSGFAGSAQSASSIQWSWTDNSSDEAGFRVMAGSISLSGDLAANTTVWVQPGLGVNASSGSVFVRSFNSTGTADSGTASVYTLANVPVSLATSAVFATSATVAWGANGNPVGSVTLFRVHYSSNPPSWSTVTTTAATSRTLTGLLASTTYYVRMDALNGDSIATAFTSTLSFCTDPPAPGVTLAALSVSPASVSLAPGATQPLTATGIYSDASTAAVSGLLWSSSNTSVATVSGAGLVTAAGVGSTVITVSSGVISATASVTVAYLPTGALQAAVYAVSPSSGPAGGSRALSAAGTRFGGSTTLHLERASGAGSWAAAAPLPQATQHAKAVRLDDGRVLLAGGQNTANASVILSSAAIYDAGADAWTPVPNMASRRLGFALAKLPDGRVLAVGGNSTASVYHASSEIYDPATNLWTTPASALSRARSSFGAATLLDGRMFVAGGYDGTARADADLFDPATGSWTARAPLPVARTAVELLTLPDGRVLASGGILAGSAETAQTDIWDPVANTWTTVASMGTARYAHRLALLPGNRVLALGGAGSGSIFSSAEVYDVAANSWTPVGAMSAARYNAAVERLGGKVVAVGGLLTGGVNATASADAFDPATNAWSALAAMSSARFETALVRLGDGRLLAAGGGPTNAAVTATAELLTLAVTTITATGVLAPSSFTLTGTVSLAGAATGYWDVVARGPGEGRLAGGFKVNAPALVSLALSPASAPLETGGAQAFTAAGTYDNASTQTFTSLVVWASSPTSVAVVSTAGVVTAVGAGSAVITASSGSIIASASVTVSAFPAPTGFAGTALGATSILWSWTDSATAELGYRVMNGTANLSGSLPAGTTSWTQTGLTPNTVYGPYFARVFNSSATADSNTASRRTRAASPSGSTVASFSATAATVSWSSNGNPAGTVAELHKSTDNASFSLFLSSPVSTVHDSSLLGCTSYYYKALYLNADLVASAFDATVLVRTADTVPAAPAGLTAEAVAGGRVAFTWTGSPTEGVTGYRLYSDGGTGTFAFGSPLGVFTSTESSWTSGVLASSASYAFALRAVHRCGVEETSGVLAAAASTATLAAVRAAIKNPEAGKRIAGNRVTVMAELTAGTPLLVSQVVFQFRASTAAPWADIPAANLNHPNPDLGAPYFTHWDVTGLAAGPYQLRAVAYQGANADPAPGAITVIVDPVSPDITENVVAGEIRKQQSVNNTVVNTIASGGNDAADALAKIVLPPGAVNTTTVTVTVETNPTITTASPAGFAAVGSSIRIDLSNGQHLLSGGQTACLTFSYPGNVTDPSALSIMSLNEATGAWTRDFATTVNASSRTVTGCTPHFSIFAVFQGVATATLLDGVRLYPNPYKPNSGSVNEGRPFSQGDETTGIIIDQLPARVTIEIYSVSGRLVTRFDTSASGGKVRWNARNSDGRDAASGGYFAVISSPGMKPIVKKFIIIR